MGSEQNARNGLKRRGDGACGFADQYTIVDLDIGADALIARYKGTKREAWIADVVRGVVQRQRTAKPPDENFVRWLRRSRSIPAITIIDLGRDGTKDGWEEVDGKRRKAGKNWCVILDGRQRDMGQREVDKIEEEAGRPKRLLDCDYFVPSAKTPREDVVFYRVATALRVARSHSSRAEDAADLREQRYADEDIAGLVEARDVAEVETLIALHACCDAVKAAVDEGRYPLADVARCKLNTLPEDEQIRRTSRSTAAPKGANGKAARGARDGAAKARAKTRPARVLASVEEELRRAAGERRDDAKDEDTLRAFIVADVIAWARGNADAPAWLSKYVDSAKAVGQ